MDMADVQQEIVIVADGRPLGRVATEVASALIGKHSTSVVRNAVLPIHVRVTGAAKISISEKKRAQKEYQRYSGYPGGQKRFSMEHLIATKGHEEVLRKAVQGMLPRNKLRTLRMKQLTIEA